MSSGLSTAAMALRAGLAVTSRWTPAATAMDEETGFSIVDSLKVR